MPIVNITWLSWVTFAVVAYYGLLLLVPVLRKVLRLFRRRISAVDMRPPFIIVVIPAHNEEAVLGQTLNTLEALSYRDRLVLVMDDGSTDLTAQIASAFTWCGRVQVVTRGPEIAGQGKGEVLNHAFALVSKMAAEGDPRLRGRTADEIVFGVMDADGQLEADALTKVAPYFTGRRNARVGGVQIGVRIANATANLLTRMQDFEFVGFSALVQGSRNTFGSVGLGGNGQFTRLSALQALRRAPWTKCLTEDLDLSLSLAEAGWDIRYCSETFVAQQGLTRLWLLLRQRTRWIQGHYQCWRHLPTIWSSRKLPWWTKLDLSIYLMMIVFVLVVTIGLAVSLLGWAGVVIPVNTSLDTVTNPYFHNIAQLLLSAGPLVAFIGVYQHRATTPLRWWELPAVAVLFALYAYLFVLSQFWAWSRILARRGSWAKTPRVRAEIAVQMST
jgi:cellulose synthase/poly-beta-1,6-N-acetylglucosamine synthase-like glycosyltransferase